MKKSYKIINDPVHGFINIPSGLIQEIIEHPYFQRLRDIRQLGMTNLVYPGATHSRLLHALGAMHLMKEAIDALRSKGIEIDVSEEEASMCAMLLHDIGHGPFSHALENNLLVGISHEEISLAMMKAINKEKNNALAKTIEIFEDKYPKHFLHQLVSSQLDVDRLDYLRRDSFFSGVAEGMIGHERIIKMLNVHENSLVVEEKGIYSVEKFLISRRLMFWQVYFHKTVIAAEQLLIQILRRARELTQSSVQLQGSPAIFFFMKNKFSEDDLEDRSIIDKFAMLDDNDFISAIKQWQYCDDKILSLLSRNLSMRRLPKIILSSEPINPELCSGEDYLVQCGEVVNEGYNIEGEFIGIMSKDGKVKNIYDISDMLSAKAFSQVTKKYFLCTARL